MGFFLRRDIRQYFMLQAAGFMYDLSKSYYTLLLFSIPVCLVSALVMLWIGGYPKFAEAPDAELATA